MARVNEATQRILHTLELSQEAKDEYTSNGENEGWGQVFGGQLIAQSLHAAALAQVDSKEIISLHFSFLSRADVRQPIKFQVNRLQDGKSFARIQVLASQSEELRTAATVTFQKSIPGLEHQMAMPDVPPPEESADLAAVERIYRNFYPKDLPDAEAPAAIPVQPVEMRFVNPERLLQPESEPGSQMVWVRFAQELDLDPGLHKAVLGYMSDQSIAHIALQPHAVGAYDPRLSLLSLDHSISFHRPFRADAWLLFVRRCDSLFRGRALVNGSFFSEEGTLVASMSQNAYIRVRD